MDDIGNFSSISGLTRFHRFNAEIVPSLLDIEFTTIEDEYRNQGRSIYRCELVFTKDNTRFKVKPEEIDSIQKVLEEAKKLISGLEIEDTDQDKGELS